MSQATLSDRPYANSNLFSGYYLDERIEDREEWDCDAAASEALEELQDLYDLESGLVDGYKEDPLIDNWIDEVLEILGFGTNVETTLPEGGGYVDVLLFEDTQARRDAAEVYLSTEDTTDLFDRGVGLVEAKQWDADFTTRFSDQRPYRNASHQIKHYLERTPERIQWGVLTNGRKWRLYGTKDYETQTYYEIDLPELLERGDLEAFKYFYLFFRPEAFRESGGTTFLDSVRSESETVAQELGEDLQDNVFTALRVLGRGFAETNDLAIEPGDDDGLAELKEQSLVLLYRLMFVLYAESRGLIHPEGGDAVAEYEENFSLDELRLEIHEEIGEVDEGFADAYSDHSTTMWSRLEDLFRLIDEGEESLGIPPYNGGLFNRDKHEFLADHEVSNRYLAEVIYRISTTENDEGRYVLADYADLDTRHLGSVYEGLLEHQFRIAAEDYAAVAADGGQVWKPATEVSVAEAVETVDEGGLYVVNDEGERKATGAYYTPDYVVTYIVEETVGPLVEEIKDDLESQGFEPGTHEYLGAFYRRVTDLKLLDPAMGSGHFLTRATEYLAQQVMEEVRELEEATAFDEQRVRRDVAKECIYGVDLNGMAVELAKLSMWLETLAADQPLAFLDHHLKAGNSLVGSDVTEVLSSEHADDDGQLTLQQALARVRQDTLEHVMERMQELLEIDNESLADVKSMEEIYDEVRGDAFYQRLFEVANVHTAEQFDLDVPEGAYERLARAIDDDEAWAEMREEPWFQTAQSMSSDEAFFHWELEYPEVFFDDDGEKREGAGFDAVIGNPPYVKIQELRQTVPEQANYLTNSYQSATGNFDLYVCFTEKGHQLLSDSSNLGYIEPHKFFQGNFGEGLREYLSEHNALKKIVSFGDSQVFEAATIYTCLLFLSKSPQEEFEYTEVDTEVLEGSENIELNTIRADYGADSWAFNSARVASVLETVADAGPELQEVSEKVFQGIATSADAVYILEPVSEPDDGEITVKSQKTNETHTLETGLLKPMLKGNDSDRYRRVDPRLKVIFPYEISEDNSEAEFVSKQRLEQKYPKTYEYLCSHEETLRQRESGKMDHDQWWDYVYPKNLLDYEREYIITPRLGNQPEFTLKPGSIYHNTDIEGIPLEENCSLDPKYVLALLNSNVFWFFMVNTGSTFRGGYYTFRSEYLYPFSIARGNKDINIDESIPNEIEESYTEYLEGVIDREQIVQTLFSEEAEFDVQHEWLCHLSEKIMSHNDSLDSLTLDPLEYLANYSEGPSLDNAGFYQPPKTAPTDSILYETAEERDNLRIGCVEIRRPSHDTVVVTATARYKPDNESDYETDRWGYTETDPIEAFRLTDLGELEADLIEVFVPVAVEEANGFANFRETATKTNSPVDRLKALTLPEIDSVDTELGHYLETKERAEELEAKIEKTDELIDEIVYELYELTDEEIEIVEEAVGE
ncbi:putative restriction/modification enzyme [Natrinema thermotolerans DSM 11552]|nr:putative restriction/modification enzyme [Natrinema thermotolerans DSM 11552]